MIIHLNGWPGVGKYTIGKTLSEKLDARFIHNHLLHDVALACAGHGDDERWPLYKKVRAAAYDVLARRPSTEIFVMTNALCKGDKREVDAWNKVVELATYRSVPLIPVILQADTETIAHRLSSNDRSEMKLKDATKLMEMVSAYSLQVPDVPETLEVDVNETTAEQAANKIHRRVKEALITAEPASPRHKVLK